MPLKLLLRTLHDPAAQEPRQLRLYQLLKGAIADGRLGPGTRLPSSRQLAADHGLARNTVLFSYQQLLAEGWVQAHRGGTRVASRGPDHEAAPPMAPACAGMLSARARQLPALHAHESLLPFAPGVPDLNAFPWASWARCLQQAWGEVRARQLVAGHPGGAPELRHSVAQFLSGRRGVVCTPEQVFIVVGAQMALDACARLLADSGDTAWLENPGYGAARNTMLAAGLDVVGVPVDAQGMAPDEGLWQRSPPRLIVLTSSHQYPTGAVLSLQRRLDFLRRLHGRDTWLIEDDYGSDFRHARASPALPAIQGLQPQAPVIYIGTFSKLLYPGLRMAYMVVPRWAVRELGKAIRNLYRSGQVVEQRALARFLNSGQLTHHMRRMAGLLYFSGMYGPDALCKLHVVMRTGLHACIRLA
ncbi:aminotransferase-like domain-containing protein [Azohydromonas lata]|uniref:PLP-dependent aminotransferase family protein n=1 Tax=Azohydromonas lata TaxID=45677 RepID=A0ABU5I9L3_9BURK|nr:PLP-dependent aminotransferase family protein [Azohydromonas lata]MDZ5455340.1 PLP-dependent aminotransferase family protein [Azohydromonas lata]